MAKQIARLLKADIQESSDLKSIAKMLSKKGRGGDTMLAHITPKEAAILKEAGGAGTVNPDTGLLEFYDWSGGSYVGDTYYSASPASYSGGGYDWSGFTAPSFEAPAAPAAAAAPSYDWSGSSVYEQPSVSAPPVQVEAPAIPQDLTFSAAQLPAARTAAQEAGIGVIPETPPPPSVLQKYVTDPLEQFKKATGLSAADLIRLGGAGAGAVAGRAQAQQAAKQIQQAVQEQKQIGKPYQEEGQKLQRAALAGELTPQSAQAYQALRAQMAQGIESRGGVGVAQAQAQLEAFRQNLLQNQYNYGIQVAQIGDQYAIGAIKTGLQLDQNIAAITNQFYSNLAAIASGTAPARTQQ